MEAENIENITESEYKGIPSFFEPGYVNRVVDALPSYFPNYLKERLKREHPDIPVIKMEEECEETYINYHNICAPYYYGGHHLNEMLTESLSLTILTGVNDYVKTDTVYRRTLLEPFLSDYGRNNSTVELIQCMQVAMLSGDFSETNRLLKEKYNMNIFEFLRDFDNKVIDEKYTTIQEEKDDCHTVGKFDIDKLQIQIDTLEWELITKQKELLSLLEERLKLERIPLSKDIDKTKERIEEVKEDMKLSYANVARIGTHETLHYLSYSPNERRIGFKVLDDTQLYLLSSTY